VAARAFVATLPPVTVAQLRALVTPLAKVIVLQCVFDRENEDEATPETVLEQIFTP
jgi:hypothetical protein